MRLDEELDLKLSGALACLSGFESPRLRCFEGAAEVQLVEELARNASGL